MFNSRSFVTKIAPMMAMIMGVCNVIKNSSEENGNKFKYLLFTDEKRERKFLIKWIDLKKQ